jgi:CubicO group peptidase (beta-lactamase class C family)
VRLRRYPATIALGWLLLGLGPAPLPLVAQHAASYAEAPAPERYAEAIDFGRLIMTAIMERSGTPGMSVAVAVDGKILWSEGFGYADAENRVPVWEETKFRIGSVSKPLTAAALGLLYEQGRLDLDAPVQRYVPSFPEKRWPVTSRQVAGHLAGIRHYRGDEWLSNRRYATVLEGLEIFQDDSLLFEPGERFSYSSYGWNLLSAVVEGASGVDFLTYMQDNVFGPLGMIHTVAEHTDSIIPQRTSFYQRAEDGRVLNAPYVDNSYKWAGGGFISTPEDLVRFGMAHLGEGFLARGTVEMLWTSQRTNDGSETGYGIGWGTGTIDGNRSVSHGGGSVGGTTFLLVLPERRAAVAMVGNMTQAPTGPAPSWLILQAFLAPERPEVVAEAAGPDLSGVYQCSGEYRGESIGSGRLDLRGTPADYWGRIAWSNETTDEIIYAVSGADETRLISVDGRGGLTETRIRRADGGLLVGEWSSGGRRGGLTCESR